MVADVIDDPGNWGLDVGSVTSKQTAALHINPETVRSFRPMTSRGDALFGIHCPSGDAASR
jgi:hypothetical protein